MTDRSVSPVLSAIEREVAASLLGDAWGEPVEICAAEVVWKRRHVVRLGTRDGRSVILKRPRRDRQGGEPEREAFGIELASLEYLAGMPVPVAPRLLGADVTAGVLLMEELPAGRSMADSLLLGDRATATADMVAYATALGSVHAWSIGRTAGFERARARYSPAAGSRPWWLERIERGRGQFLRVASVLGVATEGVDAEIDGLLRMLGGPRDLSFVHGDLCPDNVRLADGRIRFFDFEGSSLGAAALDAAYLLAPFPSCWCFASLPAEVAAPAVAAYRGCLREAGIQLGPDWDAVTAAALASFIIARGRMVGRALGEDRPWGTTTMRPRLLTWLRTFTDTASRAGVLPRLHDLAGALHDQLSRRWPGLVIAQYPALVQPGAAALPLPDWWPPKD